MFLSELLVCGKCSYNCSQIDNFEGNTNCFNTSVKTNSFTNIRRRGFSLRTSPGSRRDESNSSVYTQTMSLEQTTCEDLKAFERRLTEVIACLRPNTIRWRMILIISTVCTAIGTWQWLNDPLTSQVSFTDSLLNHLFFTLSSLILGLLFLMGIHKRVVAPSIITARTRVVLADFNMSCDETGKLILKPRPANT